MPLFLAGGFHLLQDGILGDAQQLRQTTGVQIPLHGAVQSGQHPGALKDAVCSPGGSTIRGIQVLEQGGFRGMAMACVMAAYEKNKELAKF